jgi:hypothetical protein
MATLAIEQMQFSFMPPPAPLPTELHNLKMNRLEPGQLGNTIRRGDKWANVPRGHDLLLTQGLDHKIVGHGRVEKVWTGPFNEVPATVLDRNHSGSQSYSSVLLAMRDAYGADFSEDEIVVFLDYKRIS